MSLNPPTQYRTDTNLRARQRIWEHQQPPFDLVAWVLRLAGLDERPAQRVLDVGCGNGAYVRRLAELGSDAVGCDLSPGMLVATATGTPGALLANADVVRLPFHDASFDVVLAPHMLYHVEDRTGAAAELRRALRSGGRCVVVTNGVDHMRSLRALIESAVRVATPGWQMRDPVTEAFSLENGEAQLRAAFAEVSRVDADEAPAVVLDDASIAADYVASIADHYQPQTSRPWDEVVADVRSSVQRSIDTTGSFVVHGRTGAFICT